MYYPTLDEVKKLSSEGNLVPVYREIVADLETPVSAFLKIHRGGNSFLLESVEGGSHMARFSFIGTEPYLVKKTENTDKVDPLAGISTEINRYKIVNVAGLPRFCGGAVGFLSYEAVTRFEELPSPGSDPVSLPESVFMFTDTMLAFDHISHSIKVISHVRLDGDIETNYENAVHKIEDLIARLSQPLPANDEYDTEGDCTSPQSNFSRRDFEAAVSKIKEYITAGEAVQVVLSQRLSKQTNVRALDIYRALRSINPSPYMFFLDFKDYQIIGSSPEILVRVEDGKVMTRPLAGTRPRGATAAEDAALEKELRSSEKERAEHIMLVDLGRNDIGRVSEPGSVQVSDLMEVERYSHVMHLVTHVQGRLRKGTNAFEALTGLFPGRDGFRRSQDKSDGDHRGARTGETRPICRRSRLFFLLRQYGHGYRYQDDSHEKTECVRPGWGRHRL